ncbi:Uncharacterized protein TPAR_00938 [Tolypocladium paradoxum]|uniref:Zn(2)-C6 fungal-type domain-containing protein n=1 Tax=Tolypocladium paradoxum TaxID=94208 RepID=A0A2S4L8U8_9HYPO|nr:Uncharacterized protein TPAR_00938 [Tolypocladium paradoxum]
MNRKGEPATVFDMSLAKRNNGCLECRMCRVCCDKAEPECFKCRKKGIKCSGQGIECRFSSHMVHKSSASSSQPVTGAAGTSTQAHGSPLPSRAGKRYRWRNMVGTQPATRAPRPDKSESSSRRRSAVLSVSPGGPGSPLSEEARDDGSLTPDTPSLAPFSLILARGALDQSITQLASPRAAIEAVPPQARMLFDHCPSPSELMSIFYFAVSNFIAAKMVIFDLTGNGYRQIILALAYQDETVGRAVSVIAAFHLAQKAPHMRMAAEMGQQAISSRLCRDSLRLEPNRFFSLSTWATILVLLVGDTITGSNNYVHLLELLSSLAQSSASTPQGHSSRSKPECELSALKPLPSHFLRLSTNLGDENRFELFGFPLSSEKKGLKTLTKCPDYYLDFITSYPSLSLDPEQYSNGIIIKDTIRQACELYRKRALHSTSRELSIESIERLRQTVLGLEPSVDGCHALVWAYFVAAAESILPEHRDFFSNRLRSLFEYTRFGTIPLALETLQLIWASSSSWTEIVTHQRPILII